ncbi:oligosaccharide flippase family protein [Rhizorhabdus argentea]|uniref:oligosaccharide flippase family protein n=1 Tax=Rhizorhabdus argentea TaxID=1387174 RepID=UPI0030EE688B
MRRIYAAAGSVTGVLMMTTAATVLVRTVSSLMLTRLVAPDVFGLIGIINSIFFTITMLTDLGFQSYLVRHPEGDDPRFRDVIWTIHAGRGALLALGGMAAAPLIAAFLHKPQLAFPLAVASTIFLVEGFTSLALTTTLRSGGARRLTIIDFCLALFQTVLCIVLAVWLRNAWAFILAMIAQSLARTIASYSLFPDSRRRPARDRAWSREFMLFSRIVIVSSMLTLVVSQADKIALARIMSLHDFGFYAIALNLTSAANSFVGAYVSRIAYPVYAQVWNGNRSRLGEYYYAVRRRASLLYALGCGALTGGGGFVVALLYDVRYAPVAPYLSLLAISCTLRLPNRSASEVMTATGQVKVTLYGNIVRAIWLALAGPIGFLLFGPIGVIAAVGLIELPVLGFHWVVLHRASLFDLREELAYLAVAGVGAASGFAVTVTAARLVPGW